MKQETWVRAMSTTKATGTSGGACFIVGRHDGSNSSVAIASNSNLFTFAGCSAGTRYNKFILDYEGDIFYAGGSNACHWDEYCDVALLTGMRAITMPEGSYFKNQFSSFIDDYACVLEQTGVVHLNRDTDSVPFVSTKGLNGLMIDSIRQLHGKVVTMENQLKALQGGCP
jgi:hypothetical protein